MPTSISAVVDELENALKKSGAPFLKISWQKLYQINAMQRFKNRRADLLHAEAVSRGIAIGWGKHAVFAAFDDRVNLNDNLL